MEKGMFSFSHAPSALNEFQGYAIFAKVEEGEEESAAADDHAKHYFDDFFNTNEQEVTTQNEPVSETGKRGISWPVYVQNYGRARV